MKVWEFYLLKVILMAAGLWLLADCIGLKRPFQLTIGGVLVWLCIELRGRLQ